MSGPALDDQVIRALYLLVTWVKIKRSTDALIFLPHDTFLLICLLWSRSGRNGLVHCCYQLCERYAMSLIGLRLL